MLYSGSITLRTPARLELESQWRALGEFPEFSAPSSPRSSSPPPLLPSPAKPRNSRLAVASLVCGVFGFLLAPALVALLLGIFALVQIRRSNGSLAGKGVAWAGIIVAVGSAFSGILLVWALSQMRFDQRGPRQTAQSECSLNLSKLGSAVRLYANDHADQFPAAARWCDEVRDYVPSMSVFVCPGHANAGSSFTFNESLSGLNAERVSPDCVMLFEAHAGWNSHGTSELANSGKGRRGNILVALAGGQVFLVAPEGLKALRWTP
ncbi:MAG: DUF4190 domain-containing protein [Verrucomicrobia bacterium]|nr:DUF4190 domain-containing protein [Verrucomicrobiota bacterium]